MSNEMVPYIRINWLVGKRLLGETTVYHVAHSMVKPSCSLRTKYREWDSMTAASLVPRVLWRQESELSERERENCGLAIRLANVQITEDVLR